MQTNQPQHAQPLTDPTQSWEFVPGWESSEAYEAFAWYRDLGTKRTLVRVARDLGIGYGSVVRWAAQFLWRDRALFYDSHRAQERESKRRELEQQTDTAWAERRAELHSQAEEIATMAMARLYRDLVQRHGTMRPNEVLRFWDRVMHWGNTNNGDVTERVDFGLDLSNMSDEQLKALEPVLRSVRAQYGADTEGDDEG